MVFQRETPAAFDAIRDFYWALIDDMRDRNDQIGWKKGIYPTDAFLRESLERGELFALREAGELCGCVILNSACNEGYQGAPWSVDCPAGEVLVPHALAVAWRRQGTGLGRHLVEEILNHARAAGKKAVRLDILGTNTAAERLYNGCGFAFVQAKTMFYEDTGWTEYKMYELNL